MTDQLNRIINAMITSTWLEGREGHGEKARPGYVVTVSRQAGSGGEAIAQQLAERLGLPCFNKQLVEQIAQEASTDPEILKDLEDKISSIKPNWLETLFSDRPWLRVKYLDHLTSVLLGISRVGGVVVGRGAHLLLGKHTRLRVRVVAPLDVRVKRYARRHDLDPDVAHAEVKAIDKERRTFIESLYRTKLRRICQYDLVINTERLSIDAAVDCIVNVLDSLEAETGTQTNQTPS